MCVSGPAREWMNEYIIYILQVYVHHLYQILGCTLGLVPVHLSVKVGCALGLGQHPTLKGAQKQPHTVYTCTHEIHIFPVTL